MGRNEGGFWGGWEESRLAVCRQVYCDSCYSLYKRVDPRLSCSSKRHGNSFPRFQRRYSSETSLFRKTLRSSTWKCSLLLLLSEISTLLVGLLGTLYKAGIFIFIPFFARTKRTSLCVLCVWMVFKQRHLHSGIYPQKMCSAPS